MRTARDGPSSSANCSGVVSRMSGGAWRWRWRRDGGRVAGAGLHRDRQTHLGDRRFQIARHIHRQRLERRDVERVRASRGRASVWAVRPRSIRLGRKPARVLPPPVGATSSTLSPFRALPPAPSGAAGRPAVGGEPVLEQGRQHGGLYNGPRPQKLCGNSTRSSAVSARPPACRKSCPPLSRCRRG